LLLGQSAYDLERHWAGLFQATNYYGYAGAEMRAISALDIALWDILGMAEAIQRILTRRAVAGHHPTTTDPIIGWLEATARGWTAAPPACRWGGKRPARRQRSRARCHRRGGWGACTPRPIQRRCSWPGHRPAA
jgi:hypothetical protein